MKPVAAKQDSRLMENEVIFDKRAIIILGCGRRSKELIQVDRGRSTMRSVDCIFFLISRMGKRQERVVVVVAISLMIES